MIAIKRLLFGIGCLLVAILSFLFAIMADWVFMSIPCFIAFVVGCIFLIVGVFSLD